MMIQKSPMLLSKSTSRVIISSNDDKMKIFRHNKFTLRIFAVFYLLYNGDKYAHVKNCYKRLC